MKYPWTFKNKRKAAKRLKKLQMLGNESYVDRHYDTTLDQQLAILCYAPTGAEQIPMAYSTRSAIYNELGLYALAIENIACAKATGLPADKRSQLMYREERCRTMMQTYGLAKHPGISSFFKLSHLPNKRIPFIADCLKLSVNEEFGRHIVTTKDLKAGDIIAVETAAIGWPNQTCPIAACGFCGRNNHGNLYPCHHCASGKVGSGVWIFLIGFFCSRVLLRLVCIERSCPLQRNLRELYG